MSKGSHTREPENTIQRQIINNPDMAELYRDNERKFLGDLKAMERWAREGFTSSPESSHDISDGGLR